MPRVILTSHLTSHAGGREFSVSGSTVREVLEDLFVTCPKLRSYVLDDQGTLRHHVVAFVNGKVVANKQTLDDLVPQDGEVHILQALSGGN
jgi:molybdopterin synthase sulfur carrier subunit